MRNYAARVAFGMIVFIYPVNFLQAQQVQKLNIIDATVFLKGAQITNLVKVKLNKGENDVVFTNVAGSINSQSISANTGNGVVIESVSFKNDFLYKYEVSEKVKQLKDSITFITDEKIAIENKIANLNEQQNIIKENNKVSGTANGLSVAELQKMLDFVNIKFESILVQKSKYDKIKREYDKVLVKLENQLNEESNKNEMLSSGQIIMKLFTKEATSCDMTIKYFTPDAGWTPIYDVIVDSLTEPVKLYYKANVFQSCGINWNNIHLSISAGNPNEGAQSPVLDPNFLSFYVPTYSFFTEPAIEREDDLPPQGLTDTMAQNMGYDKRKRMNKPNMGGARAEGTLYIIDGVQTQYLSGNSSMNKYVAVDNSGVNTTFDIDLPYSVPSDGQKHLVAMKKYEVPATYRYIATPKLDQDVFLQACLTNWEDLNLLPGQTNIFYEGTYVGQGNMDTRNVKDTLTVSLGRDKKIVVKRERARKTRSVKYIGSNVRESFEYNITIRNTRREEISLIIQDQLPVSNEKSIEVNEKETGSSDFDESTGLMKWLLSVKPNETKTLNFGFSVKYPKGSNVNNLPK